MNQEFIIKMMKAKKMEYEAIKEILPDCVSDRVNKLEDDLSEILKQCIKSEMSSPERASGEKKVKKVTIES